MESCMHTSSSSCYGSKFSSSHDLEGIRFYVCSRLCCPCMASTLNWGKEGWGAIIFNPCSNINKQQLANTVIQLAGDKKAISDVYLKGDSKVCRYRAGFHPLHPTFPHFYTENVAHACACSGGLLSPSPNQKACMGTRLEHC